MSRDTPYTPDTPYIAARAVAESTPDQQAESAKYSDHPNVKGVDGAVKRIHELFGVEVTTHYLRRAISQRRLARHEICHAIHFSERDLYDFIVLGTRKNSEAKASA